MRTILHVVDIDAPPDRVWSALTDQDGLAGWWSTKVTAPAAEIGAIVDWTFVGDFNPDMRIEELEDGRRLVWRCIGGHEPWDDNTFHFEVAPLDDGRTRLRFRQEYARELDDDAYGIYNFNWGYYLESLRMLCAEGRGKPYEA